MSNPESSRSARGRTGSVGRFLLVGGASVLVERVVGLAAGTASQMLLARLLLPEQLAAYFLTQSVVEVGAHLGHLGLPRPLTRLVVQAQARDRPAEARGALVSALPLWIGAVTLVALVFAGGLGDWLARSAFRSEIMASGIAVTTAWLVFQASGDLLAGALRGFRRVGLAAWVAGTMARLVTAAALLAWFALGGRAEFVPVLALTAGAALLGPLVALATLRRDVAGVRTQPVPRRVLLASALPLLVTGMVHMASTRADLWTVGVLFEADQVALYGAAKRLIVLISLPLVVLNLVVSPIVAELHAQQDVARLQRALRGAATLAGLPALAALAVFALANEAVLGLAFGTFFREGGLILSLLSIERALFVWVGPSGMVLAMTGHERVLMIITMATGALTVVAVLVGAELFGFAGVAGGYAVGSSGQQIAIWTAVRRVTGLRTDIDVRNMASALDAVRRALRT